MRQDAKGILLQVWHFILHLRLHYQFFILSGAFLMGALLADNFSAGAFGIQFVNVHLLLFGGATAYNSFWDKDEGPIGGLQHPPEMKPWMWWASLLLQVLGLLLAFPEGYFYAGLYSVSIFFFWLYSSPWTRWKARPIKSLFAIGISTGFNAVLMGFIAAGGQPSLVTYVTAIGVMLILLSLYPVSQVYQQEEDQKRGDYTFARAYGKKGVRQFFSSSFFMGALVTSVALALKYSGLAILFGLAAVSIGLVIQYSIQKLFTEKVGSYKKVMRIKYTTSLAFVTVLAVALILKHTSAFPIFSEWLFR